MRPMFLAATLSLGLGSAYAGEIQRNADLWDDNLTPGIQENGEAVHTYVSQSSHGTWLFQGQGHQGANS